MTVLLSIVAQLLHMAVVPVAAPLLTGLIGAFDGRLSRRAAMPALSAWLDIVRLFRKQPIRVIGTSSISRFAPMAAAILAVVTAFLVPSFSVGMVSAPLADLLTLASLFALGRIVLVLAAMDAGTGAGAVAATEIAAIGLVAEPALVLAIFAISLPSGSGSLDVALTMRMDGLLSGTPAVALGVAALALLGWSERQQPAIDTPFSGRDLALLRIAEQMRLLAWCDLVGALALPFGMATVDGGLFAWGGGILAWIGRTVIVAAVLAVMRTRGAARPARTALALTLALCGIAVVLAFAGGDPT